MTFDQGSIVATLSDVELQTLPFGAIRIALDGTIKSYNQFEARLAQLDADRVVGKNFFRDIAPCTRVAAFEGRMRVFLDSQDAQSETFDYTFPFAHGTAEVAITFVRLPDPETVLIAVELIENDGSSRAKLK